MRRYPRRSPEVWLNPKKLGDSYFDPISLLGSETPELDLGLCYGKTSTRDGVMRICYQAAMPMATAPGGSNTFVPGMVDDDDQQPATYEKQPGGMLSQEDLAQIVDAMSAVIDAKIDERMAALSGSEGDAAIDEAVANDALTDTPAEPGMEGMDAGAEPPPDMAGDEAGAEPPANESPAGDAVVDSDDDDDEPVKYEHACSDNDQEDDMSDDSKEVLAKYKKDADELRVKYEKATKDNQRLSKENGELQKKVADAEAEQKRVVRYNKLREVEREGFALNADEELEDVKGLTDEQFDKHVERVRTKYQRIPMRGSQYVRPPVDMSGDQDNMEMRAKYSKEARKRVERSMAKGEALTFEEALEAVYQENGKAIKKK